MNRFYVTGGLQRKTTIGVPEWNQYERATALLVDPAKNQLLRQIHYDTPADCKPDEGDTSVLFKSGSIRDDQLFVCTQTEVLIYQLPEFTVSGHISLKCFNDVHHVVPTRRNTLLVVCSGLDLVVEIALDGSIIREWFTVIGSDWNRFSTSVDYRKIASTKPHASHPNFAFEYKDEVWVTRFEQKDCICLTNDGKLDIGVERPHDGHIFRDQCYFSTVDGHVIVADMKTRAKVHQYDLREFGQNTGVLGWCRGLHVIDSDNIIVGFSRIRPTKFHNNLLWLKKQLKNEAYEQSKTTRIAHYDLKNRKVLWEMDLEPYGLNAIFSVLPAPHSSTLTAEPGIDPVA